MIDQTLEQIAEPAVRQALADAGLDRSDIDIAFVANAVSAVTTGQVSVVGQSVLRPLGFSGLPVFNIENACAGSSSAVNLAISALRSGAASAALVLGVEKMYSEDRRATYTALNGAVDRPLLDAAGVDPGEGSVFVSTVYPRRVHDYGRRWGLDGRDLARIAVKNREHASLNPEAQYTKAMTIEDVLASRTVAEPITAFMCAPVSDGAAALVLTTGDHRRRAREAFIRGSAIGMGAPPAEGRSSVARVARRAYDEAGIGPSVISVAEVHDSIAFNELLAYEELGFCDPGAGASLVRSGTTRLGGRLPVNPSGGLESRGHPMAATGAAQIGELARQLRGEAGARQVPAARWAVAENAGGYVIDDTAAIAVTVLEAA
ncbi:thiolase family protein [Streptomyces muensis]|uniref:Thiolase family protein n=2 Tax=Streptomyces muensis TaxID=1077944 RepID=A0A9X1PU14_STRM4|nr:thiolase family protein [Streptomyces muensis]